MAASGATPQPSDVVYLRGLHVSAIVGEDAWHRANRPQPVVVNLSLHTDVVLAGKMDDVSKTVNYGSLCKSVMAKIQDTRSFKSLEDLTDVITTMAFQSSDMASMIECTVLLPKASLLAEGVGASSSYERKLGGTQGNRMQISIFVKKLRVTCIIGVNAHERVEKQTVVINMRFHSYSFERTLSYAAVIERIVRVSQVRSFFTACS